MSDFLVKRDDLRECRVVESEPPELESGQALLRVDSFGMTANNVTYAVMGEAMSYWDFFPAADGWGRVPVWGFAEVERSEAPGVEVGTRVYGYLPPSSHLLVMAGGASASGFVDGSPHRKALPSAYHRYLATAEDPFYRADTEEMQMLLRPLFFTSFLIDDQLADEGLTGRGPILISSASSKTAIAAAFMLAQRDGVELVGLTSARSAEFVERLGIYGRTVAYDAIDSLERGPATYVDISGDAAVRQSVHSHYGEELVHSMAVGLTHWEELGAGEGELPGPAPSSSSHPTRVTKRAQDWGRVGLESRVADAWHPFCEWTGGWLRTIRSEGLDGTRDAYLDVLEGGVDPATAHVLSLRRLDGRPDRHRVRHLGWGHGGSRRRAGPRAQWLGLRLHQSRAAGVQAAGGTRAESHLLGRVTYESFAGAWPEREGPFAEKMNAMPKYVVTSTLDELEWNNSTPLQGGVVDEVTKLKQADSGPILVAGSRTLVHSLIENDLVDELRLMVFPVILGSGLKVFPESPDKTTLELSDSRAFASGVQVSTYRPAT